MRGIEDVFGIIVVASVETSQSQFDIVQLTKDSIKSTTDFRKITIAHLYAEKRQELIKKIVSLKITDAQTNETARMLDQCLNSYKLAFRTDIDFVVQYVDYYCEHIGELNKADATVFSKVFEASIERSIAPQLKGRRENPNDIIVALSEVAH